MQAREKLLSKNFVLISCLSMLTGSYSIMMMTMVLMYGTAIGLDGATAGLLSSVFAFSALVVRPFSGLLVDRFSPKKLYLLGLSGFVLGPLVFLVTRNVVLLLLTRILQGAAMSLASTANAAMATAIIPKSRFTEGIGFYGIGMTLSSSIAPALGLWLLEAFDYSGMFAVSSAVMFAGLLLALCIRTGKQPAAANGGETKSGGLREFANGLYEKTALYPSLLLLLVTFAQVAVIQLLPVAAPKNRQGMLTAFYIVASVATVAVRLSGAFLKKILSDGKILVLGLGVYIAGLLVLQLGGFGVGALVVAGILYGFAGGSVQMVLNSMAVIQAPRNRTGAANATYLAASDLSYGLMPIIWGIYCGAMGYTNVFFVAAGMVAVTMALFVVRTAFIHMHHERK